MRVGGRFSAPVHTGPGAPVQWIPPSRAEVKERVEIYLYSPLSLHGLLKGETLSVHVSYHSQRSIPHLLLHAQCLISAVFSPTYKSVTVVNNKLEASIKELLTFRRLMSTIVVIPHR